MQTQGMRRWWTTYIVSIALASLAPDVGAGSPAQYCQSAKNKEAGKLALCRHKAEASLAVNGDSGRYLQSVQKCLAKFALKWPILEAKALAAGGSCPTQGDQAAIQDAIASYTTNVAQALAGAAVLRPKAPLLKTGQTLCKGQSAGTVSESYCPGSGQDGETETGVARDYVDNGDGTITDKATGLTWEKLSNDGSVHDKDRLYNWDYQTPHAFGKIAALNSSNFAGHSDWRLPNVNELHSLVNYAYSIPAVSPIFNSGCASDCTVLTCSCTLSQWHWTSTYNPQSLFSVPNSAVWMVGFTYGHIEEGEPVANSAAVRAVRGGL